MRRLIGYSLTLLATACVAPREAAPPPPQPAPRPTPTPTPPPPPAPDWRDRPYTPGDWTYSRVTGSQRSVIRGAPGAP